MAYTKTNWVDGVTPLSAGNMNKIEDKLSSLDTDLEGKVDKVTGKQLSTEDYTTEEKNLLVKVNESVDKLKKLQAYDMAIHDINNHISQPYSGMFYDLFYSAEPEKSIGYIDEDYIIPSVNPSANDNDILIDSVASSMKGIIGGTKYEFTVQDENNYEIVVAKTNGEISPLQITSANSPFTHTFQNNETVSLVLKGGSGEDKYGTAGNGGEVVGSFNVVSGDVLTIELHSGGAYGTSGKQSAAHGGAGGGGYSVKLNSILVAVVGGGGGTGGARYSDGNNGSPANGGHGGGDTGDTGGSASAGGGTGGTQSAGGIGGTPYGDGANAGENGAYLYGGKGGSSSYADSSCGGGGGGFGYYGGGGGGGAWVDGTTSVGYVAGSGGGGSSYVGGLDVVTTNTKGTNDAPPSCLVSSSTGSSFGLALDTPLINSYVSPVIYRSWIAKDTTNHKANPKQINATNISKFDVRYKVDSLDDFDELATWITSNNNLVVDEMKVSFKVNADDDELLETTVKTSNTYSDITEVRTELAKATNFKYATIRISFSMTDPLGNSDIYSILGVVS